VSPDILDKFKLLNKLMSPKKNYKRYRDFHSASKPPFVPFLGVFLTDFTFIDESNPDTLEDGTIINFQKMRMLHDRIKEFQKVSNPHSFLSDSERLTERTNKRELD